MRLLLIAGFALYNMMGPLVAEEAASSMAADRVLSAGADADGKGYTISLSLENGRQISIRIPPAEAIKIVEGLEQNCHLCTKAADRGLRSDHKHQGRYPGQSHYSDSARSDWST